jgi:septal ring factor EnvC (AmiA/AmiB activator)
MTSRAHGTSFQRFRTRTVALGLVLAAGAPVFWASSCLPSRAQPKDTSEALRARDLELETVRAEQRKAAEAERRLRTEIDELGADRRRLNLALLETASRIREVERTLAGSEARLPPLEEKERASRQLFDAKRGEIAELLAALQRIGRRPPPAIIVRPEDALQSVRSALLLGALLPEMRAKAAGLAAQIENFVRLRNEIADERARLSRNLAALAEEQRRMRLLIEERQKQQADAEKALENEKRQAIELARQADNLKDLIASLEKNLDRASRAARAAERSGESQKAVSGRPDLAALNDPGRLSPAIAFASAKGRLPLPVSGVKVREFGAPDGLGGTERGITFATRPGAQVTAPADGWVVYAGPFRSYGKLLILNAGGGYHVLLAGMDSISVDLGQFVLTGEPVATMGGGSQVAATIAIGSSQPVLYIEFRKDGTPIDPGPWWATDGSEKVRG